MSRATVTGLVEGRDPDSDGFWEAVADDTLQLRRCTRCGTSYALPLPTCPECGGAPELVVATGTGVLYTWVVVRHAFDEALADQVPYVVGVVELDEGARLVARVEGLAIADLAPETPLAATFPAEAGRPPIVFVPAGAPG